MSASKHRFSKYIIYYPPGFQDDYKRWVHHRNEDSVDAEQQFLSLLVWFPIPNPLLHSHRYEVFLLKLGPWGELVIFRIEASHLQGLSSVIMFFLGGNYKVLTTDLAESMAFPGSKWLDHEKWWCYSHVLGLIYGDESKPLTHLTILHIF